MGVDILECILHGKCKVDQCIQQLTSRLALIPRIQAGCSHISAAYGFDFLNAPVFVTFEQLVEIEYDFVEQSNALHTIVDILRVETGKVGNGCKQNGTALVRLGIQLLLQTSSAKQNKLDLLDLIPSFYLVWSVLSEKIVCHVVRQNVFKKLLIVVANLSHVLQLALGLLFP